MDKPLSGKKVAILVTNGFEQTEMTKPREALENAGAQTFLISPESGQVKGWDHTNWAESFQVDARLNQANPGNYDALMLPGGVMNGDKLRMNEEAVRFIKAFFQDNKPVAAICHALWTLIEADVVRGRRMTSYWSLKTDLRNAGANWVDEEVVVDGNLTTSRSTQDIPAFNRHMVEEFAKERIGQQA